MRNAENVKMEKAEAGFEVVNGRRGMAAGNDEEMEIDLLDLGNMLLDKIKYIILCLLIGAVLMTLYSYFRIAPTYTSVAKMYIVSASDDSVVDLTDLNIGKALTSDYEDLMLSYPVLDQVIEQLDLDMTSESLAGLISITNPTDTRILKITVTTTDAELSRDIANTLVSVSLEYLPKTMGTEQPNVAQEARVAVHKSGPSYLKYTVIGALLGAILCCGFFTVRYLMDDTIHNGEDLEKYFGIVPLTVIPDIDSIDEKKSRKYSKRGRK